MKKIRFQSLLVASWRNVENSINAIDALIDRFEAGEVRACQCRRLYFSLKESFRIDADRFLAILSAAQEFDFSSFTGWSFSPIDDACDRFRSYFEA